MYKKALSHFAKSDPVLHEIGLNIEISDLLVHPDPFLRLCRSIVGQQLSVKAASTIFGRFEKLFALQENPMPIRAGDELKKENIFLSRSSPRPVLGKMLFKKNVNPKEILSFSDVQMRGVGLSFQKIKYLRDLAEKILAKDLDLYNLQNKTNEEVITELLKVKGIGQWTAEMFLMFSLAREDVFSFGDLGLQNAIVKLYKLKDKPTVEQLEKLSKKWMPYRTYAALILWRSLDNELG